MLAVASCPSMKVSTGRVGNPRGGSFDAPVKKMRMSSTVTTSPFSVITSRSAIKGKKIAAVTYNL